MKKKILSTLLTIVMASSALVSTVSATVMYHPDGRTIEVEDSETWKYQPWYLAPVVTMYAPNGDTTVVAKSDIQKWKGYGWSEVPIKTSTTPSYTTSSAFDTLKKIIIEKGKATTSSSYALHYKKESSMIYGASYDSNENRISLTFIDNKNIGMSVITFDKYGTTIEYDFFIMIDSNNFGLSGIQNRNSTSLNNDFSIYPSYLNNASYLLRNELDSVAVKAIRLTLIELEKYLKENGYSLSVTDLGFGS